MNEEKRNQRNADRLLELHPVFRRKVAAVIKDMEKHGLRPRIQDAWRSPKDQLKAFESGHSKLKYGFHNATGKKGEKESLAADILDDDHPLAPATRYLLIYTSSARAHGCDTGVDWGLPKKLKDAVNKAIAEKKWDAPVKVGWDPTHIEISGLTVAEVKAGKRPK